MRSTPSHRAEMTNQQLFGEKSEVIDESDKEFTLIRLKYDGYEGWVQKSHLAPTTEVAFGLPDRYLTAARVQEINGKDGRILLPAGCPVPEPEGGFYADDSFDFPEPLWDAEAVSINEELIKELSYNYLNTPYLWGGKSVFGIDCSGFSQTVYKFLNIPLPRDAWQQAREGSEIGFLQEARCGDLAFFDNEEGRITHVGILLDTTRIIHASGSVRVDPIDAQGIIHFHSRKRTHRLRSVRRYF